MRPPWPVAVLCFHRVLPASRRAGPDQPYFLRQTALALDRFRALLDELERRRAVASPEHLFAWVDGRGGLFDRPRVILTFDDGYADVLEIAAPELKARGLTALLCVTTAVASGSQRGLPVDHWYATVHGASAQTGILEGVTGEAWPFDLEREEDRARLLDGPEKRAFVRASPEEQESMLGALRSALRVEGPPSGPPLLDVAALSMLVRDGWILGSHGHTHALLPLLSEADAVEELARSRAFFPEHGLPPTSILAYPDGATCPRTEALAEAAGYTIGLALGSRFAAKTDSPRRLPRLIPTNDPSWFERRLLPLFTAEAR
ncbi:MAG TPA: polysaccharide deacetylase family protein [Polyangiaceae bacterium]|nr:polysaccharide deacetylase family protein [Polyangiaceae bacterium]